MDKEVKKSCSRILNVLISHKYGWLFILPVDSQALQLPNYLEIIKKPMDLGTVNLRQRTGLYSSVDSFIYDVRLVFSNAMTYNSPGNDVHTMAHTMSNLFETELTRAQNHEVGRIVMQMTDDFGTKLKLFDLQDMKHKGLVN